MEITDPVVYGSALTVVLASVVFGYLAFKIYQLMNK